MGNNKANKAKILRYVHSKGYKVSNIKDRGFAKIELYFDDYRKANKCLNDRGNEKQEKYVSFEILRRAKSCKGIISGWTRKRHTMN